MDQDLDLDADNVSDMEAEAAEQPSSHVHRTPSEPIPALSPHQSSSTPHVYPQDDGDFDIDALLAQEELATQNAASQRQPTTLGRASIPMAATESVEDDDAFWKELDDLQQ